MTTGELHQAIGGPVLVPSSGLVIVLGYLATLVILVVFGIWGFRLGSRGSSGNPGGGGPNRPEPMTPPPGGRGLDEERLPSGIDASGVPDLPGLEDQPQEPEPDLVTSRGGQG